MRPPLSRLAGLASLVLLVAGCSAEFGAPESASAQGDHVLWLWRLMLALSALVGVVVVAALGWSIVRYRRRAGDDELPEQHEGNVPLELVAVAVPLLLVAGIFAAILVTESRQDAEAGEGDVVVEVTSYRWGWRFHYPDEDVTVSGGPDEHPELVLPVDRDARLELTSSDVVHSFFVPHFLIKRDTFPDGTGTLHVQPTRTGEFEGYCAEFCGLDHARMEFTVRVEDDGGYDDWLDEQRGAS